MRRPKNLHQYAAVDVAATGLEALAADLRLKSESGMRVRWIINLSFWHPSWDAPTTRGQALGTDDRAANLG